MKIILTSKHSSLCKRNFPCQIRMQWYQDWILIPIQTAVWYTFCFYLFCRHFTPPNGNVRLQIFLLFLTLPIKIFHPRSGSMSRCSVVNMDACQLSNISHAKPVNDQRIGCRIGQFTRMPLVNVVVASLLPSFAAWYPRTR